MNFMLFLAIKTYQEDDENRAHSIVGISLAKLISEDEENIVRVWSLLLDGLFASVSRGFCHLFIFFASHFRDEFLLRVRQYETAKQRKESRVECSVFTSTRYLANPNNCTTPIPICFNWPWIKNWSTLLNSKGFGFLSLFETRVHRFLALKYN